MVDTDSAFRNLGTGGVQCLKALVEHDVRYLTVGGNAVRIHGYSRQTNDPDVLTGNDTDDAL